MNMEKKHSKEKPSQEKKKDERSKDEPFSMTEGEICSAEFSAGCISSGQDQ